METGEDYGFRKELFVHRLKTGVILCSMSFVQEQVKLFSDYVLSSFKNHKKSVLVRCGVVW